MKNHTLKTLQAIWDIGEREFEKKETLLDSLKEIAVLASSKNDCRADIIAIAKAAINKVEEEE
jgi:hypothetical protein